MRFHSSRVKLRSHSHSRITRPRALGPIACFVAGRPERPTAAAPPDPVTYTARGRQVAPDDDPEFLGRIASRKRQEDEQMLRLWHADLRKREEELKKREQRPEDDD